ncbi:MAG: GerMN domain-containing protein [Treponema sp.]|jgi:spore germination protein GerM|nr:GerMN domain-containing protein [Treponema sp.]
MALAKKRTGARTRAPVKRRKRQKASGFMPVIFWLAFSIVVFGLFVINKDKIRETVKTSPIYEFIIKRNEEKRENTEEIINASDPAIEGLAPAGNSGSAQEAQSGAALPQNQRPAASPEPAQLKPDPSASAPVAPAPSTDAPSRQPAVSGSQSPAPANSTLRERSIYLVRIDSGGGISMIKAERKLPASGTPMIDALNSLFTGPNREEQNRGLISSIPGGSKIISAAVRDGTAYINLNEEFQYNTRGKEGLAASLRQIIWTVTEFPNVRNVQFHIEGQSIGYIGEGIKIDRPFDRGSKIE